MQIKSSQRLDRALVLALGLIALFAYIGALAPIVPQLDLFIHFQFQYLVFFAILAVIFLCRRNWLLFVISVVCMFAPLIKILPWYVGEGAERAVSFQLLCSNVKTTNTNTEAILEMIMQEDADMVVLLESSQKHQEALLELEKPYPFRYSHSLMTGSGFLLYSKFPIANIDSPVNGPSGMVSIAVTIEVQGRVMDVIAVHPIRPGLRHGGALRDAELHQITKLLQTRRENAVVIGDLNTTMWTNGYNSFVQDNSLRNIRTGFGLQPTWGLSFLKPLFSIPIDHCFVRGELHGTSFRTISLAGSDHEAIVASIHIMPNSETKNHTGTLPEFESFPSQEYLAGVPVQPQVENVTYRDKSFLQENGDVLFAPNFAGHLYAYVVGCGTNCKLLQCVDMRTGELLEHLTIIFSCGMSPESEQYSVLPEHSIDSRLLIVPCICETDGEGFHYFEYYDEQFIKVGYEEWETEWNRRSTEERR